MTVSIVDDEATDINILLTKFYLPKVSGEFWHDLKKKKKLLDWSHDTSMEMTC